MYGEYWDEDESAYVLDTENSKELAADLLKKLKSLSDKPAVSKKYSPGKYYKIFVHY